MTANVKMKILFLSRWFPYPANNGSKLRITQILSGLASHHDVTLLSFVDQPDVSPEAPKFQSICSEVHTVPWREFDPRSWKSRLGFLDPKPRSLVDTFSHEMAHKITQLTEGNEYDLVIASQLSMAAYRPYYKNIPAIFEEVEIGLSLGDKYQPLDWKTHLRRAFTWIKLRTYLSRLIHSFQACTVASEQERCLLEKYFPGHKNTIVEVIPNGVQVDEYDGHTSLVPAPNQIIFSGSFRFRANYDAMFWFTGEVFPRILERIPDAQLVITGDHANLPLPVVVNVTLTGYVDDIKSLIACSRVSIAPLLSGGGTRLKILEAMALGVPVVSTSKGAEGLNATPGVHLLMADDSQAFANHVIDILKNGELHEKLAVNGKRFIENRFNWKVILPHFLCLTEKVAK